MFSSRYKTPTQKITRVQDDYYGIVVRFDENSIYDQWYLDDELVYGCGEEYAKWYNKEAEYIYYVFCFPAVCPESKHISLSRAYNIMEYEVRKFALSQGIDYEGITVPKHEPIFLEDIYKKC